MKTLTPARRTETLEAIRTATSKFTASAAQHEQFDVMTWEDVESLDPALVEIGSHTITHPLLSGLPRDETVHEVTSSRSELERRLGRAVDFFAYPNGTFDLQALNVVRSHYLAAVGTIPGFVHRGTDPHSLPRIPATAATLPLLAWRLHRPFA